MSSQVAEKAAEVTAEVVEEAVDGVVETLEVIRTNPAFVIVAGVVGLAVGGVGGYFFAKKKLSSFYEDLANQEIAEAKEFYKGVNKVDDDGRVLTPMEVLQRRQSEEAVEALREYQGRGPNGPYETEEELIAAAKEEQGAPSDEEMDEAQIRKIESSINIFSDPHFDLEEETKHRRPERPYVISHDEYFEASENYDQAAYTYFETDDVLVDERSEPVDGVDKVIGDESLARFGHGSKDKNVVYVRNEILKMDFEITRSAGSYLEEILGLPAEPNSLKHSERDARRAFRRGDE